MNQHVPFQSFDDVSDKAQCAPRLAALRAELKRRGLDGFVIPHSDAQQNEYLPPHAERLAWLTAFTGSAGAAVVLMDRAAIFVDGRYTLQVQQPDRSVAVRAARPGGGRTAGLDPGHAVQGRAAGLRSLALHRQWRRPISPAPPSRPARRWWRWTANPIDSVWNGQPPPPMKQAGAAWLQPGG